MQISVIGGSDCTKEEEKLAFNVGKFLAKNKCIVICGGLGGVMEAVSKGAKSKNGTVVGIIPGINFHDANKFVDITIVTGMGHARNVIVAYSGEAVIAIGGKLGTLTEIMFALIKQRPVIGLNTWDLDEKRLSPYKIIKAKDPEDAVKKAISSAKRLKR